MTTTTTTTTIDLSTATPVEIDTEWERLDGIAFFARLEIDRVVDGLHYATNGKRDYVNRRGYVWRATTDEALAAAKAQAENADVAGYQRTDAAKAVEKYEAAVEAARVAHAAMDPHRAEWAARGGWTRAFIVPGGHVHSSQNCSTCNRDGKATRFGWLPRLSGHDEAEIVDQAGERACTTCYPTAPVESLGRPSRLFHADEVAAEEARKVREEAKAARLAKKIAKALTPDGSEFRVEFRSGGWVKVGEADERGAQENVWKDDARIDSERFATEQAAVQWMVQQICWRESTVHKADAFAAIKSAIATKHGMSAADVEAMIDAKVAAKRKRDAR